MDFFEAVSLRRSIRKYLPEPVPPEVIELALDAALKAPNSSNTQTWDFYWVQSKDKKALLTEACMNQSAARTAQELLVFVADPVLWKRSREPLKEWVRGANAPKVVQLYYEKITQATYRWGWFNILVPFKWVLATAIGLFRPTLRGPFSKRDLQEVSIKSCALAAENFVLAITAQGYASCMMEGFDEKRVRKLLNLPRTARIPMVISVGKEGPRGTWGPQFRIPREWVIHKV